MAKKKYIETPEKMWQLFEEYREHIKKNPRVKIEYVGRDGERVETPLEMPLIFCGFENFVADKGEINDLGNYFANSDNRYPEYSTICSRIKKAIREDQIGGGMVGQYNASITQRLNGLVDKTQTETITEPRVFKIDKQS
jgi:hypothetical protein